jgi:uncharacterized protein (DUF58 family)
MTAALLEPAFLHELEALRRFLRVGARGGQSGTGVSPRRGGSAEFDEHRAYGPGDDAARIDWLAYARTGQPYLKQFRADEDAVVRIVVDASASLGHGTPPKIDVARRIAAAVAYMALASSERCGVFVATGGAVAGAPPGRGKGSLPAVLRRLDGVEASGAVDLAAALARAAALPGRAGLLVVVSDFFDGGPVEDALRRARADGHELALVQVLDASELDPGEGGDVALVDAETGETVELTLDRTAVRAYRARLDALCEGLRALARAQGGTYVLARTDEPLGDVVRRIVAGTGARR